MTDPIRRLVGLAVSAALPAVLALLLHPASAAAQALPDAGSLLRENKREPAALPSTAVPLAPQDKPADAGSAASRTTFEVRAFRIRGATLVPEAEIQQVLAPWLHRAITFGELRQAVQAVADLYRSRGWLARPQLPAQDMVDGVVVLSITESRLGEVRIDDGGQALRFDRARIVQRLTARQGLGEPLRIDDVERAVNLLDDLPGLRASAVLAAGRQVGETDVVVRPLDQARWGGSVRLDNQGARATGASRATATMSLDSPSGIGDQWLGSAVTSGRGNDFLWLGYTRPVGADGMSAGASVSAMHYRLQREFTALDAHGDAQTFGVNARYPVLRSGARNLVVGASVERRDFANYANGAAASDKQVTAASAWADGNVRDAWLGGGLTQGGLNLATGRVDLDGLASYAAADQAGPRTAGGYSRLGWSLGRLQSVGAAHALWLSARGQHSFGNLDSSEKFGLGGPQGVRAYPSLEGSGDSGWLAALEWRYVMRPGLQWTAFYDHGHVRVNHDNSFTGAPAVNAVTLKGVGVGLDWRIDSRYALNAQVAQRLGSNPLANAMGKDSDGSLRRTRLWVAFTVNF